MRQVPYYALILIPHKAPLIMIIKQKDDDSITQFFGFISVKFHRFSHVLSERTSSLAWRGIRYAFRQHVSREIFHIERERSVGTA